MGIDLGFLGNAMFVGGIFGGTCFVLLLALGLRRLLWWLHAKWLSKRTYGKA